MLTEADFAIVKAWKGKNEKLETSIYQRFHALEFLSSYGEWLVKLPLAEVEELATSWRII